jgi:hypothetical protein
MMKKAIRIDNDTDWGLNQFKPTRFKITKENIFHYAYTSSSATSAYALLNADSTSELQISSITRSIPTSINVDSWGKTLMDSISAQKRRTSQPKGPRTESRDQAKAQKPN